MGAIPAGDLRTWVRTTARAWESGADVDVPCGTCTACCRSAMFVHIAPDEAATLERIPKALRFPAPGRPKGWIVLPHDENGRCPMLVDDRCSIYDDRPRTCRHFDCRIYAAAGLDAPGPIADRVREWRFDAPADDVRAIAVTLRSGSETERAARAVTLATISLRPSTAADDEWLYDLHRAAMRERVEEVYGAWDDDQQRVRFGDRDRRYASYVITRLGERVGTVRLRRDGVATDVGLLEVHPDHQGRGIATEVLRRLAAQHGELTLQVMKVNPARHLYERLGFAVVGETRTHVQLRRPVAASPLLFETDSA